MPMAMQHLQQKVKKRNPPLRVKLQAERDEVLLNATHAVKVTV